MLDPDHLPVLRTRFAVLGCLYVVEGAQLGHRVIWKQLRPTLEEPATDADAFFAVPAEQTQRRWEQFQEVLDQHVSTDGAVSAAVRTARTTFRAYRRWLS